MPGFPASVKGDAVLQIPPAHCHQNHPFGPAQIPAPTPPTPPLKIDAGASKVKIGGKNAAREGDTTSKCTLIACPKPSGGPGKIQQGGCSKKVKIEGKFAARVLDPTMHQGCAGPIPATTGKIVGPGISTVMIG